MQVCNSRTEEEGPASMVVRETQSSARRYHCSLITWAGITKIAATGTARSLERGLLNIAGGSLKCCTPFLQIAH